MPAVKIAAVFQKIKHWETFAAQFYNYKLFGDLPTIFGRDEKLDLSEMHHIHLASTEATQIRWTKISRQYYRTALSMIPRMTFGSFMPTTTFEMSTCC